MKDWLNPPPVFLELGPRSLKAWRPPGGVEWPLERGPDGRLTAASRDKTVAQLQIFLGRKSWQPPVRAVCGLGAQGLSVRRLTVPVAAQADFARVLRLQIESEFPLSPDELAWGWREIGQDPVKREVLVAAVRREVIEDYLTLLKAAGINPQFTVAALARNELTPAPGGSHLLLEADAETLELVWFEQGLPVAARVLPARSSPEDLLAAGEFKTVFLSGPAAEQVAGGLAGRADCRRIATPGGEGGSATTLGLQQGTAAGKPWLLLQSRAQPARLTWRFSLQQYRRQLIRLGVLLVLLAVLPYAEALLFKPLAARKIAAFKAEQEHFAAVVDPELDFLQSLKQNQPPYLDAIYVLAKAAPPGLHLDSISLNQRGEIAFKGSLPNAQALMDFRSELIKSGFLASLSVEEQTPTPDRQKLNFRINAQWQPVGLRPRLKLDLPAGTTNAAPAATP